MLGYTYTKMKYILYVQGVNYKWKICHPQLVHTRNEISRRKNGVTRQDHFLIFFCLTFTQKDLGESYIAK